MNRIISSFRFLTLILLMTACQKSPEKPNIIFILVDDMGWTDLGCYGSSYYETPYIDQLAAEGMKFTDAYASCPVCSPTRASILTGKYPTRVGITDWIAGRQNNEKLRSFMKVDPPAFSHQLALDEITLAEAFGDHGYRTAFVGKWHLGPEGYWPEDQGFDINKGGWTRGSPAGGYFSPYENPRLEDGPQMEYLTDRLTDESINFIESSLDQPFLLYLSFYTVHNPMQAKDELIQQYQQKFENERLADKETFVTGLPWMKRPDPGLWIERVVHSNPVYAAMINSLDENVGRIMEKLSELDVDKNTVIVFTSDNGGLSTSEGSPTSNLPLRAGKGWLYEGGIREPLIIKWPRTVKPGSISHSLVTSSDFFPTLLEIAGLPLLPEQHLDGLSLVPVLKSKADLSDRAIFWHYPHYSNQGGYPGSAIRAGDWKLIEYFEDNSLELYNLSEDIGEENNIAGQHPDIVRELQGQLENFRQETGAKYPRRDVK